MSTGTMSTGRTIDTMDTMEVSADTLRVSGGADMVGAYNMPLLPGAATITTTITTTTTILVAGR